MNPTVLVCVVPRWLSDDISSENPIGADNQQERLVTGFSLSFVMKIECSSVSENPQRPYAELPFEAKG